MKLLSHSVARRGDELSVHGSFRDGMKRRAGVKIVIEKGQEITGETPVISGEIRDVHGVLNGFAEIAWLLGWRPRGLMGSLARQVETYKIPPEDK
ncbi:MAG: hypothetical protein GEU78_07820 [Actinobacteria bacterium]|nr:hypothetical protein [Actinomycetota bacterium]